LQPWDMTRLNELTCSDHADTQFRVIHYWLDASSPAGGGLNINSPSATGSVSYGSAISFGTREKSVTCKKSLRLVPVAAESTFGAPI